MWYFTWILGVSLACCLGIMNVLRLEAQEALAKEHEILDPLTHLLARESVLTRLREKVDNSKRSGLPFSLLYLSLRDFKNRNTLQAHEMDATVLKVVTELKNDIRVGVDIAARVSDEEFLIALPGATLATAKRQAERIQQHILAHVTTPTQTAVEISIGAAEYAPLAESFSDLEAVEELVRQAIVQCLP